jgi:hypothetical protein
MKNGLPMSPGGHLITDSHTPDMEIRTIEMISRSLFGHITNEMWALQKPTLMSNRRRTSTLYVGELEQALRQIEFRYGVNFKMLFRDWANNAEPFDLRPNFCRTHPQTPSSPTG